MEVATVSFHLRFHGQNITSVGQQSRDTSFTSDFPIQLTPNLPSSNLQVIFRCGKKIKTWSGRCKTRMVGVETSTMCCDALTGLKSIRRSKIHQKTSLKITFIRIIPSIPDDIQSYRTSVSVFLDVFFGGFRYIFLHRSLGKWSNLDIHIFQMGWFNHQLVPRWSKWIPSDINCFLGYGLVDSKGRSRWRLRRWWRWPAPNI